MQLITTENPFQLIYARLFAFLISVKMTISFQFKCDPLVINCSIKLNKVEFQYANYDKLNITSSFRDLCILNGENDASWNLEVCCSNKFDCLFNFYLINKNSIFDTTKKRVNDLNKLNSDLYRTLFGSEKNSAPVLLIGGKDGCIYWKSFDESSTTNLNENILLNASSPIIYINSFRFSDNLRRNFEAVFNNVESKVKQSKDHNCLFALTKSGRLHLFAFDKEYFYKVLILPHYIKKCIKFRVKTQSKALDYYLVYFTMSKQIYAIDLDDCLKDTLLDPKLVQKECNLRRFLIGEP
jgi:hypothetical protein